MNENILIVLGGGLNKNDEPTQHTKLRYDKVIEIEEDYDYILCSSNKTYKKDAQRQQISEAYAGKVYLMMKGVNPEKILLEEESRDTFSNAFYCRKLFIDKMGIRNITVLTSNFHMRKTQYLMRIVFPEDEFNLSFVESDNGDVEESSLNNRLVSENEVLNFYKRYLFEEYNIRIGDMSSIENFMINYNPAICGKKDEKHEELTKKVKEKVDVSNALYF